MRFRWIHRRITQIGSKGAKAFRPGGAALAALRMDDARESAHRALIQVHLAEGNVSEARRAYERCRVVLVRDVGVEPSPATARLLARQG